MWIPSWYMSNFFPCSIERSFLVAMEHQSIWGLQFQTSSPTSYTLKKETYTREVDKSKGIYKGLMVKDSYSPPNELQNMISTFCSHWTFGILYLQYHNVQFFFFFLIRVSYCREKTVMVIVSHPRFNSYYCD